MRKETLKQKVLESRRERAEPNSERKKKMPAETICKASAGRVKAMGKAIH